MTSIPEILVGQPIIKGTRLSIGLILGWLADGQLFDKIIDTIRISTRDDIHTALVFAAEMMHEEGYIAMYKATA